jgi:hypothetical protein
MIHSIDMISELRNLVQHPSGRIEAGKIAGGKMERRFRNHQSCHT